MSFGCTVQSEMNTETRIGLFGQEEQYNRFSPFSIISSMVPKRIAMAFDVCQMCMISDVWCMVYDSWRMVNSGWWMVEGRKWKVEGVWRMEDGCGI